jgi:chromosome segregation ATPase
MARQSSRSVSSRGLGSLAARLEAEQVDVDDIADDADALETALMQATRDYMACQQAVSEGEDDLARLSGSRDAQQATLKLLDKVDAAESKRAAAEARGDEYTETDEELVGLNTAALPARADLQRQFARTMQELTVIDEHLVAIRLASQRLAKRQQRLQDRSNALSA